MGKKMIKNKQKTNSGYEANLSKFGGIQDHAEVIKAVKAVCGPKGATICDFQKYLDRNCRKKNFALKKSLAWLVDQNIVIKFKDRFWLLRPVEQSCKYIGKASKSKSLIPAVSSGRIDYNFRKLTKPCRTAPPKKGGCRKGAPKKTFKCCYTAPKKNAFSCHYNPPQRRKPKCRYKPTPKKLSTGCNKKTSQRKRFTCRYIPRKRKRVTCCCRLPKQRASSCHSRSVSRNKRTTCCYKPTKKTALCRYKACRRRPSICCYRPSPKKRRNTCCYKPVKRVLNCKYKPPCKKHHCSYKPRKKKAPKCRYKPPKCLRNSNRRTCKRPKYRDMIVTALQEKGRACFARIAQYIDKQFDTRNDFVIKQTLKWLQCKKVVRCCMGCYSLTGKPLTLYVGRCNKS